MPIIQDQDYFRTHGKLVYNDTVQKNFEIMSKSSDCRAYFNKYATSFQRGKWKNTKNIYCSTYPFLWL